MSAVAPKLNAMVSDTNGSSVFFKPTLQWNQIMKTKKNNFQQHDDQRIEIRFFELNF